MSEIVTNMGCGNIALIITAILSLIGVTIAAILNYMSNLKTNKAKIELEERVARYPYLKECFEELKIKYKQLDDDNSKLSANKSIEENIDILMQNCSNALVLYKEVEPYLIKKDRDILKERYIEIESRLSKIKQHVMNLSDTPMSNEELKEFDRQTQSLMVSFIYDLKDIISDEMTTLSDLRRSYILD